jgi:hypothetical protein
MVNRDLKYLVYTLKRQFGRSVEIYDRSFVDIDYTTGEQVTSTVASIIKRAIILPIHYRLQQKFMLFAQQFKFGGDFQIGDREIVVDKRDIPSGFEFTDSTYIVYDSKRFDIIDWYEYEGVLYQLLVRYIKEAPRRIINIRLIEKIRFVDQGVPVALFMSGQDLRSALWFSKQYNGPDATPEDLAKESMMRATMHDYAGL